MGHPRLGAACTFRGRRIAPAGRSRSFEILGHRSRNRPRGRSYRSGSRTRSAPAWDRSPDLRSVLPQGSPCPRCIARQFRFWRQGSIFGSARKAVLLRAPMSRRSPLLCRQRLVRPARWSGMRPVPRRVPRGGSAGSVREGQRPWPLRYHRFFFPPADGFLRVERVAMLMSCHGRVSRR